MKVPILICLHVVLALGWSCGCREHDDYLLPAEWNSFFKFRQGQWWVLEHDRTGFRDSIYVCQARTGWARETGHQTCKRREDLLIRFCSASDTARSISRVFRGLELYAYADYDYTYFVTAPCMFVGYYRYTNGAFLSEIDLSPWPVGGTGETIVRLDSLRIGDELHRDVVVLQSLVRNRFIGNSEGLIKLYFARNIGLVFAEIAGYAFHSYRVLPPEIASQGVCDSEVPDSSGRFKVHDGTYRLVARGG